jgi:hypothetical protein
VLVTNDRIIRNDHNVASLHEFKSARERIALNRRNDRNFRLLEARKSTIDLFYEFSLSCRFRQISKIRACAKVIADGFDQNNPARTLQLLNCPLKFRYNRKIQRVPHLRPIQSDPAEVALPTDLNRAPFRFHPMTLFIIASLNLKPLTSRRFRKTISGQ